MSDINKLERIKQAYYSGLKVQIWFNGHWENFDARDYSMYADPFSENRQYRIVGSAYADIAEKRIAELEKENANLKALRKYELNVSKLEIEKLEKENEELKEELKKWKDEWQEQVQKENDESYARTLKTIQLNKAKDLIRILLRETYGEGWNYSLDVKVKAEQFLKEIEK